MTGNEFMVKWKTSLEDESKGHDMLMILSRDYNNLLFEMCGIDREMVELLMAVSRRTNSSEARRSCVDKSARKKERKQGASAAFAQKVLDTALTSARTKYDALESYFTRDERNEIIALLVKEVALDMGAETPEQMACATCFVKKQVGVAFGRWLYEHKNGVDKA